MTVHLPIGCPYHKPGDEFLTRDNLAERVAEVDCEQCIAVATTPRIDPSHDDGRRAYATAAAERRRLMSALYSLGFERVADHGPIDYDNGKIMPGYVVEFTGDLGTILVEFS